MKNIIREFASYQEFIDIAEHRPSHLSLGQRQSRAKDIEGGFLGTVSFETAIEYARKGWGKGLEEMKKISDSISSCVYSRMLKETIEYDTTGLYVDVGTYLSGEPECMANIVETEIMGSGNKILKMLCSFGARSEVTHNEIMMRGSAVCALIDCLEKSGRSIELILTGRVGKSSNNFHEMNILAKKAGDPLEMDRLAFALCNAGFHRRLGWSVKESETPDVERYFGFSENGGYNSSINSDKGDADIYIPKIEEYQSDWQSKETASKWVLDQLKAQGVEFETV